MGNGGVEGTNSFYLRVRPPYQGHHNQKRGVTMPLDIVQIASAAISTLVPFLIEMGKSAGKKMAETLGVKGGEATAHKGQALWKKLTADAETKSIVDTLIRKPHDEKRQDIAVEDLTAYLEKNPALAHELAELLGGQEAIQTIVVDEGGGVEDATQTMEGSGQQIIAAKNKGIVRGAQQTKRK
jgi:hypothetical protein